jgi:hypothetical protein
MNTSEIVYSARALLSLTGRELIHYRDDCEPPGLLRSAKAKDKLPEIKLYPNPANDKIFVSTELEWNYSLLLYDYTGRIVIQQNLNNSGIDVSNVQNGLYLYKITDNHSVVVSGRITIMK